MKKLLLTSLLTLTITTNIRSELVDSREIAGWKIRVLKNAMDERWCNILGKEVPPTEKNVSGLYEDSHQKIKISVESSGKETVALLLSKDPYFTDESYRSYSWKESALDKRIKFDETIEEYDYGFWQRGFSSYDSVQLGGDTDVEYAKKKGHRVYK